MKHAITILELYAQHNELNAPLHDREGEADQARLCREQADDYRKAIAVLEHACAPTETVALSETDAEWIVGAIAEPKAPNEKLMAAKKSYDNAIEQKIQDKGLTAPRITPADIEANIIGEHYFTAADGVTGASDGRVGYEGGLQLLTFCVLVLRNGFTVTGESACASPENFDAELGRKIARQNAVNKVWPLMGYMLRQRLYEESMAKNDLHGLTDSERDAVTDNGHDPMMIEVAAELCHEANRAYCKALGDDSQPHWGDAPEWQRASAIAGVEFHIANPDAGPSHSHDSWLRQKEADGWKHGPVKDAEKKEHPCFVPYDQLPPEQKAKDYIFGAIVKTIAGINKG